MRPLYSDSSHRQSDTPSQISAGLLKTVCLRPSTGTEECFEKYRSNNPTVKEGKFQDCSGGGIFMVIFGRMYLVATKYSGGSPENGIAK